MRTFITCLLLVVLVCIVATNENSAMAKSKGDSNLLHVYKVNKRVSDFPDKEDFSSPETAYAVINRVIASGEKGAWQRISTKASIKRGLPPANAEKKEIKPEAAKMWLNARIVEVRIFRGIHAVVFAEVMPESKPLFFDKRIVNLENGRWLNQGQNTFGTIEEARANFARYCSEYAEKPSRPKIDNPKAYLKPFVKFLKNKAEDPKLLVMKALAKHKVVIMGETHHRPRYWAFNSSLVTESDFAKYVGTIYMELPSNDQELVDKFLANEKYDKTPIIEMLRDNLWMGWPDQPMLDFFTTVWMVNQNLEPEQKLRIVLVDMQRPWKKIEKREDWRKYEKDSRDQQMADNIIQDMREHPKERRNSLFIVGVMHTMLNFKYFEGSPVTSAGWYLRDELGADQVYAIFQHKAVGTNWGRIDGRLCLGLFDSAFVAVGNREMAFPLDEGPFGMEPFDAFADRPVQGSYRDGYNAYLYLGPLETEIFSPLIAGFYTDDFVKELERRYRISFGKGWAEAYRRDKSDAESFINWMGGIGGSWGKPRRKWKKEFLGPMNAWHRGGQNWKQAIKDEKLTYVREHPEEVKEAAKQLFTKIKNADYENILSYYSNGKWQEDGLLKNFPAWGYYMVNTRWDNWALWCCKNFKDNPIVTIELGKVFVGDKEIFGKGKSWPTVPYKLTLKDGAVLEGELPFEYNFDGVKGHWHGMKGIDWHLKK